MTNQDFAKMFQASVVAEKEAAIDDRPVTIVDAIFAVSYSLDRVAKAIEKLGTNNAATLMGAIEMLAMEVKTAGSSLSDSIYHVSSAMSEDGMED